jgi:hypothetical protein
MAQIRFILPDPIHARIRVEASMRSATIQDTCKQIFEEFLDRKDWPYVEDSERTVQSDKSCKAKSPKADTTQSRTLPLRGGKKR